MRRYFAAYMIWLLGVLSAAALALYYYRRIIAMGDNALERELAGSRAAKPPASSPPAAQEEREAGFEDTEDIGDARPPSYEQLRRRSSPSGTTD